MAMTTEDLLRELSISLDQARVLAHRIANGGTEEEGLDANLADALDRIDELGKQLNGDGDDE